MKNCKWDQHGHMISYETDDGSTITDYKQLAKSMGLTENKESTTSSYSGGSYLSGAPASVLYFGVGAIITLCLGVFLVLAWLFFDKAWAITFTVVFALGVVGGLLFLLRSIIADFMIPLLAGLGIISLIVLTIVSWNCWVLPVSIILTLALSVLGVLGIIYLFKKVLI